MLSYTYLIRFESTEQSLPLPSRRIQAHTCQLECEWSDNTTKLPSHREEIKPIGQSRKSKEKRTKAKQFFVRGHIHSLHAQSKAQASERPRRAPDAESSFPVASRRVFSRVYTRILNPNLRSETRRRCFRQQCQNGRQSKKLHPRIAPEGLRRSVLGRELGRCR